MHRHPASPMHDAQERGKTLPQIPSSKVLEGSQDTRERGAAQPGLGNARLRLDVVADG